MAGTLNKKTKIVLYFILRAREPLRVQNRMKRLRVCHYRSESMQNELKS